MSVLNCNFYSKCLANFVDVTVYLPSVHNGDAMFKTLEELYNPEQKYKTIYLLHGMLDDHSSWIRWSNVEEYAEQHKIALVMPSGQNGYYVNAVYGLKYYDFINKELPMWAEANFPLLTGKENRFIAGLSMGGYGALRHGLSTPENYAVVGAFSPACDLIEQDRITREIGLGGMVQYDAIFGGLDKIKGTENDLEFLAKSKIKENKELPMIYFGCGTEDPVVYEMTKKFCNMLKEEGCKVIFREMSGGHEWKVWNTCIKEFIERIASKEWVIL